MTEKRVSPKFSKKNLKIFLSFSLINQNMRKYRLLNLWNRCRDIKANIIVNTGIFLYLSHTRLLLWWNFSNFPRCVSASSVMINLMRHGSVYVEFHNHIGLCLKSFNTFCIIMHGVWFRCLGIFVLASLIWSNRE